MSTPVWRLHVTCVDLAVRVCRLATCRAPLPPGRRAYCSDRHARAFEREHVWWRARVAARRRAGWACHRCGFKPSTVRRDPVARRSYLRHQLRLEVHHIDPLDGDYRGVTCANHSANLEVLCHACHVACTAAHRTAPARTA